MDEENELDENLVEETNNVDNVEEVVDNNETEETPAQEEVHTYTQEDVDKILEARTNSINRKHQKELDKYRKAESILKQGLGVDNIDDINSQLTEFYTGQGIEIKDNSSLNDRDEKVLARADISEIISYGDEEVLETAKELANKKNRTVREDTVLNGLMKEISLKQATAELTKAGADKNIYDSDGFKTFASQFNPDVHITDIYNLYTKTLPAKKQPETAGSMKSTPTNTGIKDFYTPEEARKFTREELDKNPALFKAIEQSMYKWK
jgi:hypothetical protein